MAPLNDLKTLGQAVRQAVATATVTDVHTHLFYPSHGKLLLWGPDELLTYHYLVAELFTVAPGDLTCRKFRAMPKRRQADIVWEHVFNKHGALSEPARGVVTTFNALGLDVAGRDLNGIRKWFDQQDAESYMRKVFEIANIDRAVMTNNPLAPEEAGYWRQDLPGVELLKPALRIDTMLLDWPAAAAALTKAGYPAGEVLDASGAESARNFLAEWVGILEPVYLAASLGAEFVYPDEGVCAKLLDEVVIPTAGRFGLPVALMIGVRRQVNPDLGEGGDGVGVADVSALQHLCRRYPEVKFISTFLSRVNQHEHCVLARKFGNLHVEGCWWFCNNPSIIEEITRMRLELLGATFTAQHSDARVLDQLIYKWSHTRTILAGVLVDKYRELFLAGWRPSKQEIARDVRALLGGSFEEFRLK